MTRSLNASPTLVGFEKSQEKRGSFFEMNVLSANTPYVIFKNAVFAPCLLSK